MSSLWVVPALVSAFALATGDALTKRACDGQDNDFLSSWFRLFWTLPFLLPILLAVRMPQLDAVFVRAFVLALPLEAVTVVLYVRALRMSPLSLTLPLLSLTPVFLVFSSYVIAGERVSLTGAAGIALIAAGGYVLGAAESRGGLAGPLRALLREPGARAMVSVAFLYSFTSSLGKVAIGHSSAVFFGIVYYFCLVAVLAPLVFLKERRHLARFTAAGMHRKMLLPGFFYAVMVLSHMIAMSMTKVAYMISVKRSSILMGVLYGYFMFRETNIRQRFAGAAMMLAGFAVIVIAR